MEYVASLSCGKDSLAMVLRLIEERQPITKCVMYDTGMEFQAVYNNLERVRSILAANNIGLMVLRPQSDFLFDMLIRPVNAGTDKERYGYDWCGGCARWRTSSKVSTINKYLLSLGEYVQYIGIAADEANRKKDERNKLYPLIDWGMTERDCLQYCYKHGFNWLENGYELYSILDRVSCWCCGNKNLRELRNMYHFLPEYWRRLKGMQSRIDRPFKCGATIFDLERRFQEEDQQCELQFTFTDESK